MFKFIMYGSLDSYFRSLWTWLGHGHYSLRKDLAGAYFFFAGGGYPDVHFFRYLKAFSIGLVRVQWERFSGLPLSHWFLAVTIWSPHSHPLPRLWGYLAMSRHLIIKSGVAAKNRWIEAPGAVEHSSVHKTATHNKELSSSKYQ